MSSSSSVVDDSVVDAFRHGMHRGPSPSAQGPRPATSEQHKKARTEEQLQKALRETSAAFKTPEQLVPIITEKLGNQVEQRKLFRVAYEKCHRTVLSRSDVDVLEVSRHQLVVNCLNNQVVDYCRRARSRHFWSIPG